MKARNVVSLPDKAARFYRDVLRILNRANAKYLVGGSLALAHYMHLARRPKDLDIFLPREECMKVLQLLDQHGYTTEVLHPHWLAKAYCGDHFIDFIFNSGNGVVPVDETWFDGARSVRLFGVPVRLCTPEDIVWSKAFIMDRERFDGADVAHLIRDVGSDFDWDKVLDRFQHHWRVLLSHMLLYQYIFPQSNEIPEWVLHQLIGKVMDEVSQGPSNDTLCKGTLLSRDQYLHDIEELGYSDGRLHPTGLLPAEDIDEYTRAIRAEQAAKYAAQHPDEVAADPGIVAGDGIVKGSEDAA
jgi:hypothetical protein